MKIEKTVEWTVEMGSFSVTQTGEGICYIRSGALLPTEIPQLIEVLQMLQTLREKSDE